MWSTRLSTSRTLQRSSSSHAAPTSSSSRRRFSTRTRSLPPKDVTSPPRRPARWQDMPALHGWCRFISPRATTAERINCGGDLRPRGTDDRHVLDACEAGRFAECSRCPVTKEGTRSSAALEFPSCASQIPRYDGRITVCRVPPRLGPLERKRPLFFGYGCVSYAVVL